jgi:hypothetical protein
MADLECTTQILRNTSQKWEGIRVIKEQFNAAYHQLPFLKMLNMEIKIYVMESTKKLKMLPAIIFLCTMVKDPTNQDWLKLKKG